MLAQSEIIQTMLDLRRETLGSETALDDWGNVVVKKSRTDYGNRAEVIMAVLRTQI